MYHKLRRRGRPASIECEIRLQSFDESRLVGSVVIHQVTEHCHRCELGIGDGSGQKERCCSGVFSDVAAVGAGRLQRPAGLPNAIGDSLNYRSATGGPEVGYVRREQG